MKSTSQCRLLLLLQFLYDTSSETTPVSAMDILRYWESHGIHADRKSVYGDVDVLIQSGVDVVCRRERQNLYFIGNRLFELPELKLLVDAVESSRFITKKKSEQLIQKLGKLINKTEAEQLNRPLYMHGTAKSNNEGIYYTVDLIHTAIKAKQQILFQYIEYTPRQGKVLKHDGAWYAMSPYALIWEDDCYYTVGHSQRHGKLAQFRVDRITNPKLTDTDAVETPEFDAANYVSKIFGMYDDRIESVSLLCKNEKLRSVIDRFGTEVEIQIVTEDSFRVVVDVAPSPPFFAWVFTFGGDIRIEGPESVLLEMKQMAEWLK